MPAKASNSKRVKLVSWSSTATLTVKCHIGQSTRRPAKPKWQSYSNRNYMPYRGHEKIFQSVTLRCRWTVKSAINRAAENQSAMDVLFSLAYTHKSRCPFCNTLDPRGTGLKEEYKRLNERIEKYNDPSAMNHFHLGLCLNSGLNGFAVDQRKAFELYQRASALGSAMANYNLGNSYYNGRGVEVDKKKAIEHWQTAT
eukprot:scaffold12639_cov68-Cyclotella_meneghiniana.AAC.4